MPLFNPYQIGPPEEERRMPGISPRGAAPGIVKRPQRGAPRIEALNGAPEISAIYPRVPAPIQPRLGTPATEPAIRQPQRTTGATGTNAINLLQAPYGINAINPAQPAQPAQPQQSANVIRGTQRSVADFATGAERPAGISDQRVGETLGFIDSLLRNRPTGTDPGQILQFGSQLLGTQAGFQGLQDNQQAQNDQLLTVLQGGQPSFARQGDVAANPGNFQPIPAPGGQQDNIVKIVTDPVTGISSAVALDPQGNVLANTPLAGPQDNDAGDGNTKKPAKKLDSNNPRDMIALREQFSALSESDFHAAIARFKADGSIK